MPWDRPSIHPELREAIPGSPQSIFQIGQLHLQVWLLSPTKHKPGSAVTYCLSPALAQGRELPAQCARRPLRCPRVTGLHQGSHQTPTQVSPNTPEREHGEAKPPSPAIHPRPHSGASCLCGPCSFTVLSGQSDPKPTHPSKTSGQGAIPGPRMHQAPSLLPLWLVAIVYPSPVLSGATETSMGPGSSHLGLLSASLFAVFLLQTSPGLEAS